MIDVNPSDTYKKLYYKIIDPLFALVCNSNINYCVKNDVNGYPIQFAIYCKYEEYRQKALEKMHGNRLDRHKLASCICGALIEIKPLAGFNGATIIKNANEKFALYVGLNVVKTYIVFDFLDRLRATPEEKNKVKKFLKENFDMQFPDNICDTQKYVENFANALYWTHQNRDSSGKECFQYDIWAYSKIFYHLEIHNKPLIEQSYEAYLKSK